MNVLVGIEEVALAAVAGYAFVQLGFAWWLLALLFLLPDVGAVGYVFGPRFGAVTYNLVHHRAVALGVWALGLAFDQTVVQAAGLLLFFHSSVDRAFGYGLKHSDSFQHTHLGRLRGRERD